MPAASSSTVSAYLMGVLQSLPLQSPPLPPPPSTPQQPPPTPPLRTCLVAKRGQEYCRFLARGPRRTAMSPCVARAVPARDGRGVLSHKAALLTLSTWMGCDAPSTFARRRPQRGLQMWVPSATWRRGRCSCLSACLPAVPPCRALLLCMQQAGENFFLVLVLASGNGTLPGF